MSEKKDFWGELTNPADGGKNLKAVFDYVRNYSIIGAIAAAGAYVINTSSTGTLWDLTGKIHGGMLLVLAWILFSLNFTMFVRAIATFKFSRNKYVSYALYLLVGYLAFFLMGELTLSVFDKALEAGNK